MRESTLEGVIIKRCSKGLQSSTSVVTPYVAHVGVMTRGGRFTTVRAVQHKSFTVYKIKTSSSVLNAMTRPQCIFRSQNPALFISEGALLLMLCPPAGLQKICDTPKRKSKTSAESGEHNFFWKSTQKKL